MFWTNFLTLEQMFRGRLLVIFDLRAFVVLARSSVVLSLFPFSSLFFDPLPLGRTPVVNPSRSTAVFSAFVTASSLALSTRSGVSGGSTVFSVSVARSGVFALRLRRIDCVLNLMSSDWLFVFCNEIG